MCGGGGGVRGKRKMRSDRKRNGKRKRKIKEKVKEKVGEEATGRDSRGAHQNASSFHLEIQCGEQSLC